MAERYFEDYPPGAVFEGGGIAVTEAEILEFAGKYDPQAMHTDPEAAARGYFGGLIASGWHTAAMMMRLFAAHFLSPASSLASPGIDELRWVRPVRPGDVLSAGHRYRGAALALETGAGRRAQLRRGAEPKRRGRHDLEADQPPPLPPGVAVGCSKRAGPTESSPRSN
jgi:acyl dehydratase